MGAAALQYDENGDVAWDELMPGCELVTLGTHDGDLLINPLGQWRHGITVFRG